MSYARIISGDAITVVDQKTGESYTVYASQPGFDAAKEAARNGDYDQFILIATPAEMFKREFCGGRVKLEDGVVYLDDNAMHGTLSDRMIDMVRDGFDIEPLAKFMVNLNDNPSHRAVNELYGFLEASQLAITPDGHFVAYKKVREDYKDVYSGRFDNSPGTVCEMPRNGVDEDKNRLCSAGLHFCGREYLSEYPGARTMIVKINPRDVVAIPTDYNNHKGRTCRYEVIGELTGDGHDGWGARSKNRPEEQLEGSVFTGEGYNVVDTPFGYLSDLEDDGSEDVASDLLDDLEEILDDIADIIDNDISTKEVKYNSRAEARNAVRGRDDIKMVDYGPMRDRGDRWATVPVDWVEGVDYNVSPF